MESILGNTRIPDIVFNSTGRIDISTSIAKTMNLTAGDVLDVLTDEDEFYLYVKHRSSEKHGRHTATVFQSNKRGDHFRASSQKLCSAILHACGPDMDAARLCVGNPVENPDYGTLLPIITRYPL